MLVYDFNLDIVNGQKDACVSNHGNTEDGFWSEKLFWENMVPAMQPFVACWADTFTSVAHSLCVKDKIMEWNAEKRDRERNFTE